MASSATPAGVEGLEVSDQSRSSAADFSRDMMSSLSAISQPVEMSNLNTSTSAGVNSSGNQGTTSRDPAAEGQASTRIVESDPNEISPAQQSTVQKSIRRISEDDSAIGPATERPLADVPATTEQQLLITLLLHSTDTRHPYIISERYLKRRNISVADNNPINLTVYNLKDLIWRDWREDWETRPASPTSIRLIHMGRMLDDKAYLKDSRFSIGASPHVVHMSIRPQDVIDDEDAKIAKGGARDHDNTERRSGCRCVVM